MNFIKKIVFCLGLMLGLGFNSARAQSVYPSFADLAEKLIPSVVNISTTHDKDAVADENADVDSHIETTVDSIFNAPLTNKVSLGSGFIIDKQGYIITNNHVIDKAQTITVTTNDNLSYEAKIIGTDRKTDIALIKIEPKKELVPVVFGDSDKIRVGDWILAIGNPFGLGGSVTAGIISAKSRDIESGPYDNFIQTDASINQGSSGGPMFNMQGELIGVNTAIFSTNGGSMGVGFAIPTNLISFVIKELKKHGYVERGWIGIKMQSGSPDLSDSLGLSENKGIIISEVTPQSSADKAGLKAGDIILKFNNHEIDETRNLSRIVAETPIGSEAVVDIWRNRQKISLKIKIEKMPEEDFSATPTQPKNENYQAGNDLTANDTASDNSQTFFSEIGLSLSLLNADAAQKYQFSPETSGLIITNVSAESDSAKKGIKAGTLLVSVDKKPIIDFDDVKMSLIEAKQENNRPLLLQIKDGEQLYFVAVKPSSTAGEKNGQN